MHHNEINDQLAILYQHYYDTIFMYCSSYVDYNGRYRVLIEDCIHEAFLKAIDKADDFAASKNPAGWLAKAAFNRFRSELRKQRYRDKRHLSPENLEIAVDEDAKIESVLDRWASQTETKSKLKKISSVLTPIEKEIFDAYFVAGLSAEETAAKTGYSANSIRSAVARIRKRAKKIFSVFAFLFFF